MDPSQEEPSGKPNVLFIITDTGLPRSRTIVTDDGQKHTRFSSGESLLFDLIADTNEVDELGLRDPLRKAQANERLVDAMMVTSDHGRGAPVRL